MVIKGSYKLIYTVDKQQLELCVDVELKMIDELMKQYQNVYNGVVYVDGSQYFKKDLSHYVDARCAAEEIGLELKDDIKKNYVVKERHLKLKKKL